MSEYVALIGCTNDETGERFEPGDIVTDDDFPASVIESWLTIDPPVLGEALAVDEEE